MQTQSSDAETALGKSGLKLGQLTPEEKQKALSAVQSRLNEQQAHTNLAPTAPGAGLELFSVGGFFSGAACLACKAALNALAAAALVASLPEDAVAAGGVVAGETVAGRLAVSSTTEVVVMIARFFGADPAAVAKVINSASLVGGADAVENIITDLCETFGACSQGS